MLAQLLVAGLVAAGSAISKQASVRATDSVLVRGTVYDSLAGVSLVGANIQLVGVSGAVTHLRFTATSDSAGRFTILNVASGRYVVGFYHQILDSLGIDVAEHVVDIDSKNSSITLTTPSVATLVSTLCGTAASTAPRREGLLIGHVRNAATETAVVGGTVRVQWPDVQLESGKVAPLTRSGTASTYSAGWFGLCGLTVGVPVTIVAGHNADSSSSVEVVLPASGFAHVILSIASASDRSGRIEGIVVDQLQRPIASARISLSEASAREAVTSESGRFVLDSVPPGTRTLSARAVGYAPSTAVVQVNSRAITAARLSLERVTTLATVIARDSAQSANLANFTHERRSSGISAYYVEPARVAGYQQMQSVCQLINGLPGAPNCNPPTGRARGPMCEGFILNGSITTLNMSDLDPDDILGVATYPRGLPSRFIGAKPTRICNVAVWTRCPGSTIPTCRTDGSSKPVAVPPPQPLPRRESRSQQGLGVLRLTSIVLMPSPACLACRHGVRRNYPVLYWRRPSPPLRTSTT